VTRVLLLNTLMEAGGAQKAMLQLARGLEVRGYDVTVVTMYDRADYVRQFEETYGLEITDLQMKPRGAALPHRAYAFAKGIWTLIRLMRSRKIQLLQTFSHYSNILGPLAAIIAGVPIRVTNQRMSLVHRSLWLRMADRIIENSSLVHCMVSVSKVTRKHRISRDGFKPEKIVAIPNGVDASLYSSSECTASLASLREELGIGEKELIVTTVARLHPQKGHRYLLDAVPSILNEKPRAVFLLAGDGELRAPIKERVEQLEVSSSVKVLGPRSDVPDLLNISDVFVLPSLWEGMPNAVLEAMAAGLPVVATDVDGTSEVVVNGKTGLLVPPRNSRSLQLAILRLLNNAQLRRDMGSAGQKRVAEEYSLDCYVEKYDDLYTILEAEIMGSGA